MMAKSQKMTIISWKLNTKQGKNATKKIFKTKHKIFKTKILASPEHFMQPLVVMVVTLRRSATILADLSFSSGKTTKLSNELFL